MKSMVGLLGMGVEGSVLALVSAASAASAA